MRHLKLSSGLLLALLAAFMALPAFAQVSTSTTSTMAPSLVDLIREGQHTVDLFRTGAILAGVSAAINFLVNLTKLGPVAEWIKRKKLKWIRPVGALLIGFMAGLTTGVSQGMDWWMAVITAFVGLGSGGGAIAIHELVNAIRGARG